MSVFADNDQYSIVIGNKSYSSWSLRAWLGVRYVFGPKQFNEVMCFLAGVGSNDSQTTAAIKKYSPSGKVPALFDPQIGIVIHDSLAILIHLAENFNQSNLLPIDPAARAMCYAVSAEMHSGFTAIRSNMPHNCVATGKAHGLKVLQLPEVQKDIKRLEEIWVSSRKKFESLGLYLFGGFSIADCMFAPVAIRFICYDPDLQSLLSPLSIAYVKTLYSLDMVQEWIEDAKREGPETKIEQYEAFVDK